MTIEKYFPGRPAKQVQTRKERFADLNDFVTRKGGWIVSIPGDFDVMVECLPSSTLPDELAAAGWKLRDEGEGERLIPGRSWSASFSAGEANSHR